MVARKISRKAITTGEGGMCSTNNEKLYYKLLQLRNHGASITEREADYGKNYYMGVYDEVGYNLRLSDIQAAVGVAQFKKLPMLLEDRKKIADYYTEHLKNTVGLILPAADNDCVHTYQSYVILLTNGDRSLRNKIMDKFAEMDIQSRPGTIAISRTKFNMTKYGLSYGDFPISEFCEDCSVTLPIYPFMKREDADTVLGVINEFIN